MMHIIAANWDLFDRLSKEYRDNLLKSVSQMGEKARSQVRDIRATARNDLKRKFKDSLTEDQKKQIENTIQRETDKIIKDVDQIADMKKKEISNA
jgi:ribosome recycling factor